MYICIYIYIHTQFVIKMALYCNAERKIFLINDPRSIAYPYQKKNRFDPCLTSYTQINCRSKCRRLEKASRGAQHISHRRMLNKTTVNYRHMDQIAKNLKKYNNKNSKISSVSKEVEQLELSNIDGGILNWYSCFRKLVVLC